jgi:hypothetical protein
MVSYYLPKKKINRDGQLLPTKEEDKQWWLVIPPIKKNEQSPFTSIIEHRKATTLEIQVVAWDTYTSVDGL